jgi:3-deoxy-7-phosphoheptulonate synthase
VLEVAKKVAECGAHLLRGGAFKPRTRPVRVPGFGVEGLRQLKDAGEAVGLPVVSEIMDASDVAVVPRCTGSTACRSARGTCRTSRC